MDRMDGMCVALGCVYRMNGCVVNIVLHRIARDRLVLALAQENHSFPFSVPFGESLIRVTDQ